MHPEPTESRRPRGLDDAVGLGDDVGRRAGVEFQHQVLVPAVQPTVELRLSEPRPVRPSHTLRLRHTRPGQPQQMRAQRPGPQHGQVDDAQARERARPPLPVEPGAYGGTVAAVPSGCGRRDAHRLCVRASWRAVVCLAAVGRPVTQRGTRPGPPQSASLRCRPLTEAPARRRRPRPRRGRRFWPRGRAVAGRVVCGGAPVGGRAAR